MDIEKKREILQAAKTEIMRHRWDTFVDDPPAIAQGGKGVIVSGCPDFQEAIRDEHDVAATSG